MKGLKYSSSRPLIAFMAFFLLMPLLVHAAWYDSNWTYRKTITVDNTKVAATLTNLAVLISITDTDLRDDAQNDGDDILFTSSDGTTKLSHEIEKFDGSTGELVAWVKVPSLSSSSDTVLYMYYGYASAASQQNASNAWDSNYKSVLHLKEDPSGTDPQMKDSTSNANHATSQGSMTSGDLVSGKIDGSLDFDATDDYISRTYDSDFDFGTGSFSVTGWFKTTGPTGSLAGGASTETISSRVSQSTDDAEQTVSGGSMDLTSSDLELPDEGSTEQEVGMRFQSMAIPQGATIVSAYIQFTVDEVDSGVTNLTFYGHDTDNASTFTTSSNNITGRTKTTASTDWNSVPAWTSAGDAGADQKSPNINAVIQEIVDRPGWSSGNSLVVIANGAGTRTAEAYNGVPASAPLLTVTFTLEQELVSRFSDNGFKVSMREDGKVYAGLNDDSVWSADPDIPLTSTNTFDDNNWHNFAVVKSGNSNAYLYIDGSLEDTHSDFLTETDFSVQVTASTDDAEENVADGSMDLTSSDIELTYDSGNSDDQEVGLRFQSVTIPQGATINSAYIQFDVDEVDSGATNLVFYGEDTDNASTFTSAAYNITGRTKTSASVAWNSVPAWTSTSHAGADQKTPDLGTIIQEIVDRGGWSSGNSLVIIVDGTGTRVAECYDGSPDDAPILLVNYDIPFGSLSSSSSAPLHVSADAPTADSYFSGIIDEVKISNIVRSADWISTEYNNQNSPATFYSVGSEGAVPIPTYLKVTGTASKTAGSSNELTITAYDQYGSVATSYTGSKSLTFSGPSNAPSGTVPTVEGINTGSATTVSFTNGVSNSLAATLVAYKAETTTVDVSDGSINSTGNAAYDLDLTVSAGSANNLVFSQQPTNTSSGATINPAITVQVRDQWNNVRTSDGSTSVAMAINNNAGSGTLSGTTPRTASSGAATFNDLSIDNAGTEYTLDATSSGLTTATSDSFTITAGTATKLGFNQQPSNTAAASSISPAITVRILDASDNVVTSATDNVTIAIANNAGSGTLSGTLTKAASAGVATFNDLSIDNAGTGYTLTVTSGSLTAATSNAFNITVGSATKLGFNQQPSNTTAASSISPAVTVRILDANDNVVTSATDNVTIAIANNAGSGTLSGTLTKAASSGVATFNDLSINNVGTGYTLTVTSGSLTAATSDAFNITSASAGYFKVTGTASKAAGTTNELTITAYDQYGNVAAGYTGSKSLTFSGPSNAPSGTVPKVEGTDIGSGTSVNFTSGVSDSGAATLTAYKAETTTVDATDGSIHSFTETSYDLDLTVNAGSAANLAYVSGNSQTGLAGSALSSFFVVKVTDTYGNTVSGKTVSWSMTSIPAFATGQSLSSETTATDSNGEAQSQLTLGNTAGTYQVQASASSVTGSPVTFDVTGNSSAAQDITLVSGSCQSGIVSTALASPFVVKVTDSQGNAVSGVSIGWSITTVPFGSSGSELSNETTDTDSDGEAESTLTLGDKPGLYKVEASVSGLTGSPVTFTATNGTTVFIKGGSYHKISLPYQFDNGNAESVLNQLGGYNPAKWRLFRYANGAYVEYPNIPDFAPGLAYWLISANDETLAIGGTAVSSNATVVLEPGWNQIGNPFKCSVTWDAIKAANASLFNNGLVTDILWGYDTEYLEFVAATALDSWQGFWVYNASGSNVDFIIPYQ